VSAAPALIEGAVDMSAKPATRLIAKALARGDLFAAQFALPGLVPDLVRQRGSVHLFPDERSATAAAQEAVIRLYDSRTRDERKAGGYTRLTGAELAVLLGEIDVTVTYFAELSGFPQSRVIGWIDGEQDIPHSVHVLVKLLAASDANFRLAEQITEAARAPG
jgi:hypothetical protein